MRKLIACSFLVFALAGCGIGQDSNQSTASPTVNQSGTPGTAGTTPGSTPRSTATPTRTATPTPTTPPVEIPAGACLAPSDTILTWVRTGFGDIPTSSIVVVEAGPGNREGEMWDIVAFVGSNGVTRTGYSYLTNLTADEDAADATWIDVGNAKTPNWDNVAWTGDRLTTGKQAQLIAFACLGQ